MRVCHVLADQHGGGLVHAEAVARGAQARGAEIEWFFTGTGNVQSISRACDGCTGWPRVPT